MVQPAPDSELRESFVARPSILTFDETEALFEHADVEHARLSSGDTDELEVLEMGLPGMTLEVGLHSWRVATIGSTSGRHTTLFTSWDSSRSPLGFVPGAGATMRGYGPNSEYLNADPTGTLYFVLTIETEELDAAARILGRDSGAMTVGEVAEYSCRAANRLQRLMSSFAATMYRAGLGGVDPNVARRFHDQALTSSLATIGRIGCEDERTQTGRQTSLDIVTSSDDYALGRRYRTISSLDLSRTVSASERRVRYAFEDVTGVSPMQFMRSRALNEVRKELLEGAALSVAGVAFEWGFTEMGRFSQTYRKLFGELPSETLGESRRRFARES